MTTHNYQLNLEINIDDDSLLLTNNEINMFAEMVKIDLNNVILQGENLQYYKAFMRKYCHQSSLKSLSIK